jgi:hypothetical protein
MEHPSPPSLALILRFHLCLQVSERVVCCRLYFCVLCTAIANEVFKLGVLFVVAINTEQLPVATVIGIIVMFMINMMHRQFRQVLPIEFSRATTTNPRAYL